MKYKTLFRLLLKVVGVWFCGEGAIRLGGQLLYWWRYVDAPQSDTRDYVLGVAAPGLYFAVGLYLLLGGKWIADRAIPSNRPYCHECGYELTGIAGDTCPECGVAFKAPPAPIDHIESQPEDR